MSKADDDSLRARISRKLENGLETHAEPAPPGHDQFEDILRQLRKLDPDDLEGRLVIAGLVDRPRGVSQQRCLECMDYLVHLRRCDLPELALPVEPYWCCRLWRT